MPTLINLISFSKDKVRDLYDDEYNPSPSTYLYQGGRDDSRTLNLFDFGRVRSWRDIWEGDLAKCNQCPKIQDKRDELSISLGQSGHWKQIDVDVDVFEESLRRSTDTVEIAVEPFGRIGECSPVS